MDREQAEALSGALRIIAEEHHRSSAFHRRAQQRHYEAAELIEAAWGIATKGTANDHRADSRPRR